MHSQQQAEQEYAPMLGMSVLQSMPGLEVGGGSCGSGWAAQHCVHGTRAHCQPWRRIVMLGRMYLCFCCNRGVHQGGKWGAGAHTATPRLYITTCSPGSAGSASVLRGSITLAQPCQMWSSVLDPP